MSHRLIVFDDDPRLLTLLRTYFGGLGWQVEVRADAVIAKPAPLARLRDAALRAMKKP